MTAILGIAGVVYSPALLILAAVFGAVTYLLYYQASGRMLDRIYRGVEQRAATGDRNRGGFGAGPREEWTPPRQEQRRQARQQSRRERVRQAQQRRARGGGRRQANAVQQSGPSLREASQILGVDPNADEGTIKRVYRNRIKEVHPDADDGDEEQFKRVQAAYERLTE